ncbi:hypothetical protein IFM89_011868 [Coptis chinensis]|uniref:TF-B3 domain-containing protein n=1 Tax=Coptis chinensis TaxID=261450 RepID=A0A835LVA9_9MAGN|nr:hypothetical protein IFM89_011868 [Coptis chinensis]
MAGMPKKKRNSPAMFFKVLFNDFEKKLCLPKSFVSTNLNGVAPKKFTLRSSSGILWNISVEKVGDDFVLCHEWETFVKYHVLESEEIIVFSYNGNGELNFKIFGKDRCRRDTQDPQHLPFSSPYLADDDSDDDSDYSYCTKQDRPSHMLSRVLETQERKRKVLEKTGFTSDNPFCIVTMQPTYVLGTFMTLPNAFAKNYFKHAPTEAILRVPNGGAWLVGYAVGKQHVLRGGWRAFVLENQLKIYDVCIFELLDKKTTEFKVHIVRGPRLAA